MQEIAYDIECVLIGNYKIETEYDIVMARQTVRQCAKKVGMGIVDQTRVTTAVSELFRNMYNYAGGGEVIIENGEVEGHNALFWGQCIVRIRKQILRAKSTF